MFDALTPSERALAECASRGFVLPEHAAAVAATRSLADACDLDTKAVDGDQPFATHPGILTCTQWIEALAPPAKFPHVAHMACLSCGATAAVHVPRHGNNATHQWTRRHARDAHARARVCRKRSGHAGDALATRLVFAWGADARARDCVMTFASSPRLRRRPARRKLAASGVASAASVEAPTSVVAQEREGDCGREEEEGDDGRADDGLEESFTALVSGA